ncbi:MAG: N-acetylmuramoyl-L-alanine amidase-like domain-containing protein [Blastocatellia bacterium]
MRSTAKSAARRSGEAGRLLQSCRGINDFGERLERLSARLLELPYINNPLGGGPDEREAMVIRFDGFDCVTYVETALALALSREADQFTDALREMRYRDGEVDWRSRNHYMLDWIKQNQRRGIVKNITSGPHTVTKMRRLSLIKELPAKSAAFRVFPKRTLPHVRRVAQTGDIALFASTRRNLDVFHMGFLIRRGDDLWLRHASRTSGRVVEQPLTEFLKAQRTSGIILLRPLCQP